MTKNITFTHKEILEMLIKKADLHEGIWALSMGFSLKAINTIQENVAHSNAPSFLVRIESIGLAKTENLHDLALDAAKVNPVKIFS